MHYAERAPVQFPFARYKNGSCGSIYRGGNKAMRCLYFSSEAGCCTDLRKWASWGRSWYSRIAVRQCWTPRSRCKAWWRAAGCWGGIGSAGCAGTPPGRRGIVHNTSAAGSPGKRVHSTTCNETSPCIICIYTLRRCRSYFRNATTAEFLARTCVRILRCFQGVSKGFCKLSFLFFFVELIIQNTRTKAVSALRGSSALMSFAGLDLKNSIGLPWDPFPFIRPLFPLLPQ